MVGIPAREVGLRLGNSQLTLILMSRVLQLLSIASLILPFSLVADDTIPKIKTKQGQVYKNVQVVSGTTEAVRLVHDGGVVSVKTEDLPADFVKTLNLKTPSQRLKEAAGLALEELKKEEAKIQKEMETEQRRFLNEVAKIEKQSLEAEATLNRIFIEKHSVSALASIRWKKNGNWLARPDTAMIIGISKNSRKGTIHRGKLYPCGNWATKDEKGAQYSIKVYATDSKTAARVVLGKRDSK